MAGEIRPKSKEELEEMKAPYEEYCRKAFDPGNEYSKPESLKGIRWLSCTMYIFTPHSAGNLAELGAEVIKIEIPRMGTPCDTPRRSTRRTCTPSMTRGPGRVQGSAS